MAPQGDRIGGAKGQPKSPGDESTLDGKLERVVFSNPDTYWAVLRIEPDDKSLAEPGTATVSAVGSLYGVREGTPLSLRGTWETHAKYGRQFRVTSYQTKLPETLVGIERYLSSGVLPGIGPELAKRIVQRFGLETLEVIRNQPERLEEVTGIGRSRVEKITGAWHSQRQSEDVMVFLRGYGVSMSHAARILERYESDAMAIIRKNPYRLALDIWGIGFKTADAIAKNIGLENTAPERLEAGLIHALRTLGEDGHVHAPEPELLAQAAELLAIDIGFLPAALDNLASSRLVIREDLGNRGPCVSLTASWRAEKQAAEALAEIITTRAEKGTGNVDLDGLGGPEGLLAAFEREAKIELAPAQRTAITAAVGEKCVVITGGPGVGKTTIVRAIVNILSGRYRGKKGRRGRLKPRRISLAAPTGRAAKRLSESTGTAASTLHRLLEYQPRLGFQRDADNPLPIDTLIIDEVSMVDIALFRAVLLALPARAQLILVGDVDQLPSVGPGAVLADVIASNAATTVRLTEIFRQAAASQIITAAHQVNRGVVPKLAPPPGSDANRSDFYFIRRDDPVVARETIVNLVAEHIPNRFGYDAVGDIQVLSPVHRGELGTVALNDALQARLNPNIPGMPEIPRQNRAFRVGDKVMQVKNDYDKAVFNGDIGVIRQISAKEQTMVIEFADGRIVPYDKRGLDNLLHAYAVTVHKSQGSEYPVVVLPLVTQHYMMLQRTLLYTAITRGKKLVVITGSRRAVAMAVGNRKTTMRHTWLAERIRSCLDPDAAT